MPHLHNPPAGTWSFFHVIHIRTHDRLAGVRIFQWEPRKRGPGTKKGRTKLRWNAPEGDREALNLRALRYCELRNAGKDHHYAEAYSRQEPPALASGSR